MKDYFRKTIENTSSVGSKGSLPGKSDVMAFLTRHTIFSESELSMQQQVALVKTKIFNERKTARLALKKMTA